MHNPMASENPKRVKFVQTLPEGTQTSDHAAKPGSGGLVVWPPTLSQPSHFHSKPTSNLRQTSTELHREHHRNMGNKRNSQNYFLSSCRSFSGLFGSDV
eukprot:3724960-Amphidinium_carterae.1